MKNAIDSLHHWAYAIMFGVWTATLSYLVQSGKFIGFLRPEFGLLLVFASFVSLGFMFALSFRERGASEDKSVIIKALVMVTPVVYLVVMPETMLGNAAFNARYVGPEKLNTDDFLLSEKLEPSTTEHTILEIFKNAHNYNGQRVRVVGMILRDENLKQYFDGHDTVIYRFLMSCCAADARPLAIALDAHIAEAFQKDQWVRVTGVFSLQSVEEGKSIPVITNAEISPIDTPAMPYLF